MWAEPDLHFKRKISLRMSTGITENSLERIPLNIVETYFIAKERSSKKPKNRNSYKFRRTYGILR